MVEVIPKRTSSAIHPDALGVEVGAVPADMSADYKGPQNTIRPASGDLDTRNSQGILTWRGLEEGIPSTRGSAVHGGAPFAGKARTRSAGLSRVLGVSSAGRAGSVRGGVSAPTCSEAA